MEPEGQNAWEVAAETGSDIWEFVGGVFGGDGEEAVDPTGDYTPALPDYAGDVGVLFPGGGGGYGAEYAGGGAGMVDKVVRFVLSSPEAQQALKRALGIVFDRPPAWRGQPLQKSIVSVLWRQLPKKYQEPLAQRLAGMDSPIALTQAQDEIFLAMWLLDGFRALGVEDISDLLDA